MNFSIIFESIIRKIHFSVAILVLFLIITSLGMANGAVFQLVPQRFGGDIGIMTGFMIFAGIVLIAILGISLVKRRWRSTW